MPIRSPYPDVEIPEVSVYEFLFGSLTATDAERVAVTDGASVAHTTFAQLQAQVDAIAGALAARGIGVDDVVALHAPNVPAFVAVFHGILRAGATVTTVNALATGDDLAKQLKDSHASLLFTVSPLLAAARDGAAKAGLDDAHVIVLDGADGHSSLRDLLGEQRPAPQVNFNPLTHLAVLPYSSGTTGVPKGVMLTHHNLVANVLQGLAYLDVRPTDVVLAVLPFTHIYGLTVLLNLALYSRAQLVTMPRFDLAEFLRIIQDFRCTFLFVAPPIALALAKHPLVDQYDLSSVRAVMSGAAPLDTTLGDAVAARLNTRMMQGYGMSEMSPISHVIPFQNPELPSGSIGFVVPNMEAKLVDIETGAEIPVPSEGVSAPGELLCKGPNIMVGYLGNPEATAATIEADGWLHTGDIATVDSQGVFYIVDRLKELIKYKGYQVPPAELEALLISHPSIADAAVIGVPEVSVGELPKAFVVLQQGAALTEQDVIDFVAERVASHKKVRLVEFIDAIPKSSSGKILRKDLKAKVSA